jgi:hypothetical protein
MNVQKRSTYAILVGKPEGKIPLDRPRSTWKDNVVTYSVFG